ncbi:MAG TPA: hypothetical protein VNZ06_03785 [Steroidobacteraceae bacterium]|nr:hypothetical protein [Steroidobacteraceae bacterium]
MLSNLTVTRSSSVRLSLLAGAVITALIMLWAHSLADWHVDYDLSYIFRYLFSKYDYQAAGLALLVLLVAALAPARLNIRSPLTWIGQHSRLIALLSVVLLCVGVKVVYHDHPLAMDEYAAFFQSQVFAAGHLAGRFPVELMDWLIPRDFQNHFFIVSRNTGEVVSSYLPAFSLLLTPFTWLGIPWLCNPLISGLTVLAIHRLALHVFQDVAIAGAAVLLTIASPVFFADGISYYSMSAHLLANTVFALLLINPTRLRALLAGVVGSIALTLHNPVPHALFAVPWVLWLAGRDNGGRLVGSLILGYLPLCLLLGLGWVRFYAQVASAGSATVSSGGILASWQRITQAFALPSWSVVLARLIGLAKVWVWSVPLLPLLAVIGAVRWHRQPICRLLLQSALVTIVGYLIVPVDQGHGWGYRYFHSAWMALPILGAGALARPISARQASLAEEDHDIGVLMLGCAMLTLVVGVGLRAYQMNEFIAQDLTHVHSQYCLDRCVILLKAGGGPYELDLVQNDPWLRSDTIRMVSASSELNAKMLAYEFPGMHLIYRGRDGEVWTQERESAP